MAKSAPAAAAARASAITWWVVWPVRPRVMVGFGFVFVLEDCEAARACWMRVVFSVVDRATASPFEPAIITFRC